MANNAPTDGFSALETVKDWLDPRLDLLDQSNFSATAQANVDCHGTPEIAAPCPVHHLLDTISDGLCLLDRDLRIRWVNASIRSQFGGDIIGKRCFEVFHKRPNPCSPFPCLVLRAFQTGESQQQFCEYTDRDGLPERISRQAFVAQRGQDGTVTLVLEASQDQTQAYRQAVEERKHLQELAHELRRTSVGAMAANLAHEINQPLCAIHTYAQSSLRLLQNDCPDTQRLERVLKNIITQSDRAHQVVQRMRDFIKPSISRREPVCINAIARDVCDFLEPNFTREGIHVVTQLAEELPKIIADRFAIEQVLVNLLNNAIEALEPRTLARRRITLSTEQLSTQRVAAYVSDSGPGVSAETATRMFEPFYSTKPNGLGIGLALCRKIILSHGGKIQADNNPSGGCRTTIQLPCIAQMGVSAVEKENKQGHLYGNSDVLGLKK